MAGGDKLGKLVPVVACEGLCGSFRGGKDYFRQKRFRYSDRDDGKCLVLV